MWCRKRHSALSDVGKDSPEAIAGPGCLRLYETHIIPGFVNGPFNRS